jgi:hypothetical protein
MTPTRRTLMASSLAAPGIARAQGGVLIRIGGVNS